MFMSSWFPLTKKCYANMFRETCKLCSVSSVWGSRLRHGDHHLASAMPALEVCMRLAAGPAVRQMSSPERMPCSNRGGAGFPLRCTCCLPDQGVQPIVPLSHPARSKGKVLLMRGGRMALLSSSVPILASWAPLGCISTILRRGPSPRAPRSLLRRRGDAGGTWTGAFLNRPGGFQGWFDRWLHPRACAQCGKAGSVQLPVSPRPAAQAHMPARSDTVFSLPAASDPASLIHLWAKRFQTVKSTLQGSRCR